MSVDHDDPGEHLLHERKRRVLVAAVGDCVHSLGVESFADWLEDLGLGYMAVKLGPAVPLGEIINKIRESRPEIVGISSRLGDLHLDRIIEEFVLSAHAAGVDPQSSGIRYCFGGLRPAANLVRAMTGEEVLPDQFTPEEERHYDFSLIAEKYGGDPRFQQFFQLIVDDYVDMATLEDFARCGTSAGSGAFSWSDELLERIRQVRGVENRPVLRAHIGIAADTVDPTVNEVRKLAEAGALEIVSLGPDQPAQAHLARFVRGEEDPNLYLRGQGGVPIRSREDLERLKEATRTGNFPMIRIYSGTDELVELARLFEDTLHMPFPAVPVFFYNQLDGRGPISILDGFHEHFQVMRWWAGLGKPLEVNDPHQWQLRNSSDDMYVADHVLSAVIALKMGIRDYIMQLMFDLPPGISPLNDLAKMKAACELVEPLERHFPFQILKETRGGLSSFPPNLYMAKGHLAMTTYWQLYLDPDIIHVVNFPEAHHEARAEDVIESCDIVKQVIKDFATGPKLNVFEDWRVKARKEELKRGAMYNLLHLALMGGYQGRVTPESFRDWAVEPEAGVARQGNDGKNFETMLLDLMNEDNYATGECGLISPDTLDLALQTGLFQAPKLTVLDKRYEMVGRCRTRIEDGACRADEYDGRKVRDEFERVDMVRARFPWYFNRSVSASDESSYIMELAEKVDQEVIRAFRQEVGLPDLACLEGEKVLLVDFGSTFTKVGILDPGDLSLQFSYVPTTPDDLRRGLASGLGVLRDCRLAGNWKPLKRAVERYALRFACSSAKGGLRVTTVGLVAGESGEALNLAALTAGGKLVSSYSGRLSEDLVRRIYLEDRPEIILLGGGVDCGGEAEVQLDNARLLAAGARRYARNSGGIPVIYAGNRDVSSQVRDALRAAGIEVRVTGNVMPEVNCFRIEAVNESIRDLFQSIIIRGKGFDVVQEMMSSRFIPTPRAAFLGINLLARGFEGEEGLGNLLALDIGGATTDFFANVRSNPLYSYDGPEGQKRHKRTILRTPNAPLAYRRVEGKYGLSYDACHLTELERFQSGRMEADLLNYMNRRYPEYSPNGEALKAFYHRDGRGWGLDVGAYLAWISEHPQDLPDSVVENSLRSFLAREILVAATKNNVGWVEEKDAYFFQHGINFYSEDCTTLLIGGTIYHKCRDGLKKHREDLKMIAGGALFNPEEPFVLRPNGRVLLDAGYVVSIVGGLYGRVDPLGALRIMKRHLRSLQSRDRTKSSRSTVGLSVAR